MQVGFQQGITHEVVVAEVERARAEAHVLAHICRYSHMGVCERFWGMPACFTLSFPLRYTVTVKISVLKSLPLPVSGASLSRRFDVNIM